MIKNLIAHKGVIKYFNNTSWLFAEKILRLITGLLIGAWVAKYLGPNQFGVLSYSISYVALFSVFASLGLNEIVVKNILEYPLRISEILSTTFWLKIFGAFVSILLILLTIKLGSNDNSTNKIIFILATSTIFQSFNVFDLYFQSKVLSKYVVYANFGSQFLSSIFKILLITYKAPLIFFAYVALFDVIILAIGLTLFFVKKTDFNLKLFVFNKKIAQQLFNSSWPLIMSGFIISVYMKIDQIMIKEMLDLHSVGLYSAAVRISEAWYFIPMVLTGSLFPAIINSKKISSKLYYLRLQSLFNLLFWFSTILSIIVTFFGDIFISFLYGDEYSQSSLVLTVHIWAGIAVSFGAVWSKWIIAENKQKYIIVFHLSSMLMNILMNLILIPIYGILGSAIATAFSCISAQLIALFFYKRKISLQFLLNAIIPFKYIMRP